MELELKLAFPPGAEARLRAHPALRAHKRGRARRQRLAATYFDTEDYRLAARGVVLRVRREGARWVQALKGAATQASGGGLAARAEHEWPLGRGTRRPAPDLDRLDEVPLGRAVARLARKWPLVPLFVTEVERTTVPLAFPDGTTALAAVDIGRVRALSGSRRRAAIAELELELEAGDAARLFDLALALAAGLPLRVELRSKAERGYALLAPRPPVPLRAEPVDYPRDAPAAEAFAAILRGCLRQIEGNAAGLVDGDDPEWIHQMRIGARRMRSALALARPLLGADAARPVADELRWLAGALAPARDLDVFAEEALPAVRAAAGQALAPGATLESALAALAERARSARPEARALAQAAVRSARFQRLLLAGGALAAGMRSAAGSSTGESADAPAAGEFARGVLKRRLRRLLRAGDGLARSSPEERHALRIAAKKLRYATEFFAPCFPGRRQRSYRKALAALQDVLGRLNDGAVAATLAADLDAPDAPAAALVAGWAAARAQAEGAALESALARLRRAARFWND